MPGLREEIEYTPCKQDPLVLLMKESHVRPAAKDVPQSSDYAVTRESTSDVDNTEFWTGFKREKDVFIVIDGLP